MAEDQDQSQKTEEPTHKRLEEAVKRGQIAFSREVGSFFMFLALAIIIMGLAPSILKNASQILLPFIERPDSFPMDAGNLGQVLKNLLQSILGIMAPAMVIAIAAALAGNMIQNKFNISTSPITPKLEKISVFSGIKRLFSMRSLVEFIKSILKIIIVGVVATYAVLPKLDQLKQLPNDDLETLLFYLAELAGRMMIGICCVMFLIAILDYLYQRYEFMKSLRMTKQELKDEYKQQEGDPMVKQRLRSLRMERARRRMMAAVPTSDVVITNPTHYAVALKYNAKEMPAPKLIAKGVDKVALRIRELAEEHDIPIVENPPLARTLHSAVQLDEEIPVEHYKAVAEVIGYVYKLKGKLGLQKR